MWFARLAGRLASYWAKFCVMLIALGWFGLELLDRLAPQASAAVAAEPAAEAVTPPAVEQAVEPAQPPIDAAAAPPAAWASLAEETRRSLSSWSESVPTQLTLAACAGLAVGLIARPGVNRLAHQRRLRGARRRARLHERDLRLLAAESTRTPAISHRPTCTAPADLGYGLEAPARPPLV
jgi:hypothetical protein